MAEDIREEVARAYEKEIAGRRPLVIDCDTGTDDAVMLAMALGCGVFDIRAVTSAAGNVSQAYTSANNLNITEYLHWDVPVARGAARTLYPRARHASTVHGENGIGDAVIPEAKKKHFEEEAAPEVIRRIATEEEGRLELLVTGPMTNVAIALTLYPELKTLLRRITFMGGAVKGGNVVPEAEFNTWFDPVAAHIVFTSGIPLLMVGLDVTERAQMIEDDVKKLRALQTHAGTLAADMIDFMIARGYKGEEKAFLHDGLALAACADPLCVTTKPAYVRVEWKDEATAGKTYVDFSAASPNMDVAVDLYFHRFRVWTHEAIANAR